MPDKPCPYCGRTLPCLCAPPFARTSHGTMANEIIELRRSNADLVEHLEGLLIWYRELPEPGLCPNGLELSARLREARAAIVRSEAK